MIFSKSLSYALRGVLYIAIMQDTKRFVQAEEIAEKLGVPRHFMSKILKKLAKDGIITSVKGPMGGFSLTENTLNITLYQLFEKMEGLESFTTCVLRLKECNELHPCPMHHHMKHIRAELKDFLTKTTFNDILQENSDDLISSISLAGRLNGGGQPIEAQFNTL